ncbi:MAG: YigZ family protein [Bacteroidota bacterium]
MLFDDTYKTITSQSVGIYREKGSKFIATAIPIQSEQQVKDEINQVAKRYHDARHHCYAYRLGFDGSIQRYNDDGEPSGTAGRPIMGQILSNELTLVLIVVTRYFGGTKLGVSGLIQAYKTASKEALVVASIVDCFVKEVYELKFDYGQMSLVMNKLKTSPANILFNKFETDCSIVFSIRKSLADQTIEPLSKIDNSNLTFLRYE